MYVYIWMVFTSLIIMNIDECYMKSIPETLENL